MQTRFAVMTLHNAEAQLTATVLVAYLNGRWTAYKFGDVAISQRLPLRDASRREPRVASWRERGIGTVTNLTKPLAEIGMLLKRYGTFLSRAYYYDDPMDWRVKEIKEYTIAEMVNTTTLWVPSFRDALRGAILDVWRPARGESATANAIRNSRVSSLVANLSMRATNLHNRTAGQRMTMTGYAGLLASNPGMFWHGTTYICTDNSGRAFLNRRDAYWRLGSTIGKCIGYSREGRDFEGVYNELLEMFSLDGNGDPSEVYQYIEGRSLTIGRIKGALNQIHNNTIVLGDCGHFFEDGTGQRIGQRGRLTTLHWCPACVRDRSVVLHDVPNARWPRDHAFYSETHDRWYSYDINALERANTGEAIMSYGTNVTSLLRADPMISSSHYGDFLLGFELEMTSGTGVEATSAARDVRRRLGVDYCIVKHDGSLPSNGFEVVTAPRGIAEHVKRVSEWEINSRYRAWDTGSCGLHVHIHSRAFTEMTLGKFIMFYNHENNATFIRRLAGRHPFKDSQAASYAAQESQTILANPKAAVKGKGMERYRMVNTTNLSHNEAKRLGLPNHGSGRYDTIEVRIYKASLKKERLLAQLEFTHAAVMFCRVASYRDLTGKAFLQWLAPNAKSYPHLANWFGVRRSKALKDAGSASLEEACLDKVLDPDAKPTPRQTLTTTQSRY